MTHKLIFSNDYDGRVHVDFEHVPAAGVRFVGPLGLLGELEQRAGLTCGEPKDSDRIERLKVAIADHISNHKDSIFKDSFELDKDTVANRILRWRDALVMAGWNATCNVDSPLLNELSLIEAAFDKAKEGGNYRSVSDRWIEVRNYYKQNCIKGIEIEVVNDKSQINPTILAILDAINTNGGKVQFSPSQQNGPEVTAYQFDDVYDAYLHAAISLNPEKDVIITQDAKAFNNFLNLIGRSNTSSTLKDCNAPILQLFKLELLLLAEPKNIYNMVSYLKTRPCPVKGGSRLAEYLMKNCGWGDENDWQRFLDDTYTKDDETVPFYDEKQKDAVQAFKDRMTAKRKDIKFSDVSQTIKDLKTWAENQTRAAESNKNDYTLSGTEKAELNTLKGFCNRFTEIGRQEEELVTAEELVKYAENIYEAGEYENTEAVIGAFETYPSLGCIYSPVKEGNVVWIDCYGEIPVDYDYDFLSAEEKKSLESKGIKTWSTADQAAAKVASLKQAALSCGKNLVLYVPIKASGETVKTSPLLTCLGANIVKAPKLDVSKEKIVELPQKRLYYQLSEGIQKHRTGKESYSSLNMLINSPLDYVMQYLAGLYAPDMSNLQGLSRIEGLIAHKTLENLIAKSNKDVDAILKEVSANLDSCIDEAAEQVGLVMLLSENALEYDKLKNTLKVSFTNLLNIIKSNNLSIVGMELIYNDAPSDITAGYSDLEARIDLVLKDGSDKYYIFDLKFSKPDSYRKTLKENHGKVLQLDVYKHCMEKAQDCHVAFTGFFMLTDGKLYTADSNVLKKEDIVVVLERNKDATDKPIEHLKNSYAYRYAEFAKGKIEEGEGEECKRKTSRTAAKENLDYFRDEEGNSLYPFDVNSDKTKMVNQYSNYKVFKGGQK